MSLTYEEAKRHKGNIVKFEDEKGNEIIGKLVRVHEQGIVIQGLPRSKNLQGIGNGFLPKPFLSPFLSHPLYMISEYYFPGISRFTPFKRTFW